MYPQLLDELVPDETIESVNSYWLWQRLWIEAEQGIDTISDWPYQSLPEEETGDYES